MNKRLFKEKYGNEAGAVAYKCMRVMWRLYGFTSKTWVVKWSDLDRMVDRCNWKEIEDVLSDDESVDVNSTGE